MTPCRSVPLVALGRSRRPDSEKGLERRLPLREIGNLLAVRRPRHTGGMHAIIGLWRSNQLDNTALRGDPQPHLKVRTMRQVCAVSTDASLNLRADDDLRRCDRIPAEAADLLDPRGAVHRYCTDP